MKPKLTNKYGIVVLLLLGIYTFVDYMNTGEVYWFRLLKEQPIKLIVYGFCWTVFAYFLKKNVKTEEDIIKTHFTLWRMMLGVALLLVVMVILIVVFTLR